MVVAELGGTPVEEIPVKNLIYGYSLNAAGSVSWSMNSRHPKCTRAILEPGQSELYLYRDGSLVWGGLLWLASAEDNGDLIRFGGNGWLSKLDHRYISTTKDYVNVEQVDIAWDLIEYTQAKSYGDIGIQRYSTTGTGILRERHYPAWERKNIGEALKELASVIDGFDFEITPDKLWKTYYPRKMSGDAYKFHTQKNIRGWGNVISAEHVASEITALGEGDGETMLISVASDTPALVSFGRLEETEEFRDVNVQATLDAHAQEELRLAKVQQVQPQVQVWTDDPPFGAYAVGDLAHLRVDHGYTQIDADFRITAITVAVSNEGKEAIGLYFGEEGQEA